jgi:hypothetical protein
MRTCFCVFLFLSWALIIQNAAATNTNRVDVSVGLHTESICSYLRLFSLGEGILFTLMCVDIKFWASTLSHAYG